MYGGTHPWDVRRDRWTLRTVLSKCSRSNCANCAERPVAPRYRNMARTAGFRGGQAEVVRDHDPPAALPPPSHEVLAAPARPSARTVRTDGLTETVRRRAATPTMSEGGDSTPRRCRGVDPYAGLAHPTGTVHGVELSGRCSRRIGCSVILMVSPGCTAVTVPSSRCTKARPGSGVVMAVPESVQRTMAS